MKIALTISALLIATSLVFCNDSKGNSSPENNPEIIEKKDKSNKAGKEEPITSGTVSIREKWELPGRLREVSGIAYLDDQRFAAIQDEEGIIFIYNRASGQTERQIRFAGPGDYEDIAIAGNTAYVVRADGRLYEVNVDKENNLVKEYKTPLTAAHNVEGLCIDRENNRLLLAIKNGEPGTPGYKGVYAFDLAEKQLLKEPVFKIDLTHSVFNTSQGKKNKEIMPSAIGIHPLTGEIYITDGPKSRLLLMDSRGNIKGLYQLGKDFAQPEGLAFNPQGEIFISNEGTKQLGNIIEVELK